VSISDSLLCELRGNLFEKTTFLEEQLQGMTNDREAIRCELMRIQAQIELLTKLLKTSATYTPEYPPP
jgi:hypothetical protein